MSVTPKVFIFLLFCLFLNQCISLDTGNAILLPAGKHDSCTEYSSVRRSAFLWGGLPVADTSVEIPESSEQVVVIKQVFTDFDAVVSFLFGVTTSYVQDHIVVMQCPLTVKYVHDTNEMKQKGLEKANQSYGRTNFWAIHNRTGDFRNLAEGQTVFPGRDQAIHLYMLDGSVLKGSLVEYTENSVTIESNKRVNIPFHEIAFLYLEDSK